VEEALKWFYRSECDIIDKTGQRCSRQVIVEYFIWDTNYYAPKHISDEYANRKLKLGDARYRIFLDTICDPVKLQIEGKNILAYTFTRSKLNEEWQRAFDANPKIWLEKSKRGKREPAIVNQVAAVLIRTLFKRLERMPVRKKFRCPVHGDQLQHLSNSDLEHLKEIEELIHPFPTFIPSTKLVYNYNGRIEQFLEIRPEQIFVPEILSTIDSKEWENRIPMIKHFFTKRNLISLGILFWSIRQVIDRDLREQLLLIFVSNLHMTAKFDRLGNFGRWGTNRYISHDDFKENNILEQLLKGWREVKYIKEAIWQQNSTLQQYVFDECWDTKDFLLNLSIPNKKTVLWLRLDARNLGSEIGRRIVDLIFTDPPYRGEVESIQYFELSTFYTSWLSLDKDWLARYGDFNWWKDEVIENQKQGKTMTSYYEFLEKSFASVDAITKRNAIWIITYHSPSKEVWERVRHALIISTRLKPPTYEQVVTHKIRAKGRGSFNVTRYGSVGEDAYIVLRKRKEEEIEVSKRLTEAEFLDLLLRKMKKSIVKNCGIVNWTLFQEHYPAIVLKHGGPFSDSKSYKDFFENITIELTTESRIFDRDKIGDKLYRIIYGRITPTRLLKRALKICGQNRREISRSEMEYKILPKIDGRISDRTRTKLLKELFEYDPIGNKYIYRDRRLRTLERWLPRPPRKKPIVLPMPQEVLMKLTEEAKKYGGHRVRELRENFHLLIEAGYKKFNVNVNDQGGIRRFGASATLDEKKELIIVFLYHGLDSDQLKTLANLVKPAILIAVPSYTKYQVVIDAFRKYDPMEILQSMVFSP
jgi:hypothetical protein